MYIYIYIYIYIYLYIYIYIYIYIGSTHFQSSTRGLSSCPDDVCCAAVGCAIFGHPIACAAAKRWIDSWVNPWIDSLVNPNLTFVLNTDDVRGSVVGGSVFSHPLAGAATRYDQPLQPPGQTRIARRLLRGGRVA